MWYTEVYSPSPVKMKGVDTMRSRKLQFEFKPDGAWKHKRNMLDKEYRKKSNLIDWLMAFF